MDWKLIFQLSLFGLAMALGTVFWIPSNVEPLFWLVIFLVCAYLIARTRREKPFLHGLLVGLANSVWVTAAHLAFFGVYLEHHAREAEMMRSSPFAAHPQLMMALTGPAIGLASGVVLGLFAWVAGKLVGRRQTA